MTTTLTRRWPSSLTLADLGSRVVVGTDNDVANGIIVAVTQCAKPDAGGRLEEFGFTGPHTHVLIASLDVPGSHPRHLITADHQGAVLLAPTGSLDDAATEAIALTRPADPGHPSRRDSALALAARAAARVRDGVVGAALATATGHFLTVLIAVVLIRTGTEVALAAPPRLHMQLIGAILFGAGGGILIRLLYVAGRMGGRS